MEDLSHQNQRLNRMTKSVFTTNSLAELRLGVSDLFDLFQDILTDPIQSYADLKARVEAVSEGRVANIRSKYLMHDEAGYNTGNFTQNEDNSIVKILLDFVSMMDTCSKTMVSKVEDKQQEILIMENKMKLMEERIRKTEDVIQSQKDFYTEKQSENAHLINRNQQLTDQLTQKSKKISEMEKLNNVINWEQEKKKLCIQSDDRIAELEKEVEELKSCNVSIKKKMTTMENSYKRMLMKNQLMADKTNSPVSSCDESDHKTDPADNVNVHKLSKQNFMQDKDIVYLEKQLYDLQTAMVGVIGGMKCDFKQMSCKFIDREGCMDEQFKNLSTRMDVIYKAVGENSVDKVREMLPPHYRYLEDDQYKVKRIRRLSQPAVLPNQRVLSNILDDKKPILSPIPQTCQVSPRPHLEPIPQSHATTNGTPLAKNAKVPASTNPVIIDPVTKKLHPINPIKYFPFMAQAFIYDQYKKFQDYDKNGDGTLDLEEMVVVVKQLGFQFNPHQLQEAMEEVDRDENHTLDFFEYMLIIDNIYRRNGKADLFKEGFSELRKKNMSKTCSIQ